MDMVEATELALREKRYRDAVTHASCFAMQEGRQLSERERILFFRAYDEMIQAQEQQDETVSLQDRIKTFEMVIQLLDDWLIEDAKSPEDLTICYWKKDGDYHWAMSKMPC